MENIPRSVKTFGFVLSGNEIYVKEIGLPIINALSDTYRQLGISEVPDEKAKEKPIFALDTGNDFFTQIVITIYDHEIITGWIIGQILDAAKNKIVEIFKEKKSKKHEKMNGKILISFVKNNNHVTTRLSIEDISAEENNQIIKKIIESLNSVESDSTDE